MYRDKNGILQTPLREQAVHYHLTLTCIKAARPDFPLSSLVIPPNSAQKLSVTYWEYLRLIFGLSGILNIVILYHYNYNY